MVKKYQRSEYKSYSPDGYNESVFVRIGNKMIKGLCERPIDSEGAYMVYISRESLDELEIDVTVVDKRRDAVGIDVLEDHIYIKKE
jgi:hypothetical protein